MVYYELGLLPFAHLRKLRILKFWCKPVRSDNTILRSAHLKMWEHCEGGKSNWVTQVKCEIFSLGHGYYWLD